MEFSTQTSVPSVPGTKNNKLLLQIAVGTGILALLISAVFGYKYYAARATLTKASSAFDANNYNLAIGEADAILARDPSNLPALVSKSIFLSQKGSLEFKEIEYGTQALSFANKAISVNGNSSEAYRARAYAYEIMGEYANAHQDYDKAIALDSKNALALFGSAHTYDLEGNLTKAESGYRATLTVNATLAGAHSGLARVLSLQGKTDEALSEFNAALALTSSVHEQAEIHYSIAMLKKAKNDLEGALASAKKATELDPTYPLGWYGYGSILLSQAVQSNVSATQRVALLSGSNEALNNAITLNPNQTLAYIDLAAGFALSGRSSIALEILTKAESVLPNDISLNAIQKKEIQDQITRQRADIKRLVAEGAK